MVSTGFNYPDDDPGSLRQSPLLYPTPSQKRLSRGAGD